VWAEVEAVSLEFDRPMVREVRFTFHATKPERKVSNWGLKIRDTGEFFVFESGFVADGLAGATGCTTGVLESSGKSLTGINPSTRYTPSLLPISTHSRRYSGSSTG
jgi:hypothetical protein